MSFKKFAALFGLSLLTSLAFALEVKPYSAPEFAAPCKPHFERGRQ